MTTTTDFTPDELDQVRVELHRCEQIQSWAPGSTRSSWTSELREIIDAAEAGDTDRLGTAITEANAEAVRLATEVAKGLIDLYLLAKRVEEEARWEDASEGLLDEIESATTVDALIGIVRREGWTLNDGDHGERDGWNIDADTATAYATIRSWSSGMTGWVEIDLATGAVTVEP